VNSLPKTASRLRFEPGPSALESSTLTSRLPSHPLVQYFVKKRETIAEYIYSYLTVSLLSTLLTKDGTFLCSNILCLETVFVNCSYDYLFDVGLCLCECHNTLEVSSRWYSETGPSSSLRP